MLITVDCLRADHTGFLGYKRPTTPFLDSVAAESLVFSSALAAGAPTYYSFPAIMASRFPLGFGRDVIGLAPDEPTVASTLEKSGYATGAFIAGNPYLSPRFGYDKGFDVFRDFLNAQTDSDSNATRPIASSRWNSRLSEACHRSASLGALYDELYFQYCQRLASQSVESMDSLRRFPAADVVVDHARDWLSGISGSPFFLWLHFMDPHSPYYPPEQALQWMDSKVNASRARYLNSYWNRSDLGARRLMSCREEVIALYDAGIRWVDTQVARLAQTLREFGLWDDCVFALTADHGEEFLDHGGRYHSPSKVTEELVRVPLLLRDPGVRRGGVVEAPFSLIHLAPTLLHALDIPAPASFRGRNHWTNLKNGQRWQDDAIVECVSSCNNPFRIADRLGSRILAVREARYKLVLDFGSLVEQLFDLEMDPAELQPLPVDVAKLIRRRLLERARRHLAESRQSRDDHQLMAARVRGLRLEWAHSATTIPA